MAGLLQYGIAHHSHPTDNILRLRNAICVASGRFFINKATPTMVASTAALMIAKEIRRRRLVESELGFSATKAR